MHEVIDFVMAVVPWLFAIIILITFFTSTIVFVPADKLKVPERKFFGKELPDGRVIAMSNEVGIQARTLKPGLHFFVPFLYTFHDVALTTIADDEIGLVESIDGKPVPQGRIFGEVAEGHDLFQDGEAFMKSGFKGRQLQVIPPGQYRINNKLFKVSKVKATEVKSGFIGIVKAQDGKALETGLLAPSVSGHSNFEDAAAFLKNNGYRGPQIDVLRAGLYRINTFLFTVEIIQQVEIQPDHVGLVTALDGKQLPAGEFIAIEVDGHEDYQNGQAFINAGGQRGPQLTVLRPGRYNINPLLFVVEMADAVKIERGQVGVIISNVGMKYTPPSKPKALSSAQSVTAVEGESVEEMVFVDPHAEPTEHYVVPEGYKGIQKHVLQPGSYYINTRAAIVHKVPTTNVTVDWDDDEKTRFDPIVAISKDGFKINMNVKVIFRVMPDSAPYMVAKIGSIENLLSGVLHPQIDSSFRNSASVANGMAFMQNRSVQQEEAKNHTADCLNKYHVETVDVLICAIELPQDLMDTQTRKIISNQQIEMFKSEEEAQSARIQVENKKAEANAQAKLVDANMAVSIEEANKKRIVIQAQAKGEALVIEAKSDKEAAEIRGQGEAARIEAVGQATAGAYSAQVAALGAGSVASIEMIKMIADKGVKITPDVLVTGSDGSSGLLNTFLAQSIVGKSDLLSKQVGADKTLAGSAQEA